MLPSGQTQKNKGSAFCFRVSSILKKLVKFTVGTFTNLRVSWLDQAKTRSNKSME